MISVTIEVNDASLTAVMTRAESELSDLSPIYKLWGLEALRWIDMNFRRGGSPPWAEVKRPGQPLRDTGRLAQSFTYEATSFGLEVGTNYRGLGGGPVAQWLHVGTPAHQISAINRKALHFFMPISLEIIPLRGRAGSEIFAKSVENPGMPARPLLPTPEQVNSEMDLVRITEAYLDQRLGNA